MILVRFGQIVGWLAIAAGLAGIAVGLANALGLLDMAASRSPAKQVYDGLMTAFYGLVVGLLAEIAARLDRRERA